jgi:hypothetical protein
MPKERAKENLNKRDLMREQLAHQAAKLMAKDGITDHAHAKRKAARQLGATDTQHLPSNQEVDDALHSYRVLYQHDSHPGILHQLREEALTTMRLLFLLQHKIDFDDGEWKVRFNGHEEIVPSYTLTSESGTQTHIMVLPENARHSGSRHPETHAEIAAVEALLAG